MGHCGSPAGSRPDSSEKGRVSGGSDGKEETEEVEPRNSLKRQEGIVGECCGTRTWVAHRIFLCPPTHPQKPLRELQTQNQPEDYCSPLSTCARI